MRKILVLAFWLSTIAASFAQTSVRQSGNVTPGHPSVFLTNGVIGDGGTPQNGAATGYGVTLNNAFGFCQNSGPTSAAYQRVCFGATTAGGSVITAQSFGGAPAASLSFNIGGVNYPFSLAAGGGPASAVTVTPTGGITSTNVQSALAELDTKKAAITNLASVAFSGAITDLAGRNSNWSLGTETNPQAPFVISKNVTTGLPVAAGTALAIVAADTGGGQLELDGYGTGANPVFLFRTARGTAASPTALAANDLIGAFGARPYTSTLPGFVTSNTGRVVFVYTDAGANNGTAVEFDGTPNGGNRAQFARGQAGFIVGPSTTDPGAGVITADAGYKINGILAWSATAPTISAGFCATSPSITASNGTAAFDIFVGTSCSGSVGTLGMPAATTGWVCSFANVTNPATSVVSQTGGANNTVTLTNYVRTTGVAGNFTASDHIRAKCTAY